MRLSIFVNGLRLAIATTTTPANVDALIAHTLGVDALGWFEVIGAGNVVPNLKPAGDIYHYVLKQMNLKANQQVHPHHRTQNQGDAFSDNT
jgi:beta-phosphoglucomutase-like phosphatase (HAD superfamily)